jgi:hypothetical protein
MIRRSEHVPAQGETPPARGRAARIMDTAFPDRTAQQERAAGVRSNLTPKSGPMFTLYVRCLGAPLLLDGMVGTVPWEFRGRHERWRIEVGDMVIQEGKGTPSIPLAVALVIEALWAHYLSPEVDHREEEHRLYSELHHRTGAKMPCTHPHGFPLSPPVNINSTPTCPLCGKGPNR